MGKSSGLTCRLVLRTFQRDLIHLCTPILLQMVQFRVNAITKHIDSGARVLPPAWSTLYWARWLADAGSCHHHQPPPRPSMGHAHTNIAQLYITLNISINYIHLASYHKFITFIMTEGIRQSQKWRISRPDDDMTSFPLLPRSCNNCDIFFVLGLKG